MTEFARGLEIDIQVDESAEVIKEEMFLYKDMRRKLIAAGVSEDEIAIAKEHTSEEKRNPNP